MIINCYAVVINDKLKLMGWDSIIFTFYHWIISLFFVFAGLSFIMTIFHQLLKASGGCVIFLREWLAGSFIPIKQSESSKPSHVYFSQRQQCCKGGGTTLRRVIWNCRERSSDASTSCFLQHLLIKVTGVSRKGKSPAQITVQISAAVK